PFSSSPPTARSALSLHDALPISRTVRPIGADRSAVRQGTFAPAPGCGPSAPVQRALPPVLVECLAPEKGVNTTTTTSSAAAAPRSEEHTSELQSRFDLVCRLLLE